MSNGLLVSLRHLTLLFFVTDCFRTLEPAHALDFRWIAIAVAYVLLKTRHLRMKLIISSFNKKNLRFLRGTL